MGEMDAYRDIFLAESADYIQSIVDGLLALESQPEDLAPVEIVFRGAHSLKGMAAAMGYDQTADLTHKMESLMDRVRHEDLAVSAELIDLMLESTDLVKASIDAESGGGPAVDVTAIAARLLAGAEGGSFGTSSRSAESSALDDGGGQPDGANTNADSGRDEDGHDYRVHIHLDESCVLKAVRAYMVIKRLSHMGTIVSTEPSARDIEDEQFDRSFVVVLNSRSDKSAVEKAVRGVSEVATCSVDSVIARPTEKEPEDQEDSPSPIKRKAIPKLSETQTVRVAIGHLDTLVNLVGELVILRSRLERVVQDIDSTELRETIQALHSVSGELQHEVMQTRMVPVGNIFNRFPRMVRDLAQDLGKEVAFDMDGLDIELDRTVLDEIGDPIVHLLRNSIDHGVEVAEDRVAAGKPRRGSIKLKAVREREYVHITVSDDGKGIDPEVIWRKAVECGMAEEGSRSEHSDQDIFLYTCAPGFSTMTKATKVSGRGVGMDVVKGKIEHLGGTVAISSSVGSGTEFVLRLPLTLAIVQALMLGTADGQTFAVPLSAVDEVLEPDNVKIDTIDGAPVTVLRNGSIVSMHRLDSLLGLSERSSQTPDSGDRIVLIDVGGVPKALIVNRILGRQEIVIKPLSRMFRDIRGLAGATVLGDGQVALIIDPRSVFPSKEDLS